MKNLIYGEQEVSSNLLLRRAETEDILDIALLEEITFPTPWSEESIRHDVESNDIALVAVAEWNGSFAGYMDVWQVAGEGQLNNIGILPDYRGLGIGEHLMKYMMDWLITCGNEEMTLEVRASNERARHLYRKLGFEEIGVRPGYYLDDGEDAILMRKQL